MRSRWLIVLCLLFAANVARADVPSSAAAIGSRIRIEARVDLEAHRIEGVVTTRFENTSSAPIDALVFHRYLEAFRDDRSVFMRESRGVLRGVQVEGEAGMELRALSVDGVSRLEQIERELIAGDFTQFRVPLLRALEPGEVLTIRIEFVSRMPKLAARAGYVGDFLLVAQWFPKLAKLEDDGEFASFPYHGLGEFYADFADYEVVLDVPADATVEGTGAIASTSTKDGRRVLRFLAPSVHDAAYVVARSFETEESRCDYVRIRTTFPRAFVLAAREHARMTCRGLRFLSRELGPYPYPTLTVIVPPEGAEGGAGMEYPSAFVTSGPWYQSALSPYSTAIETTLHELAHQWFQGLVATNEVKHPVLDEGLSSFVGYDLMRVVLHRDDAARFDLWRPYVTRPNEVPPLSHVSAFDWGDLGSSVYGRSAMVFETLARTFGRQKLYRALGRYARANRFKHPGPNELLEAFDQEYGEGFGKRVVEPLLFRGELIRLEAKVREDGRLVAYVRGSTSMPIAVRMTTSSGTSWTSFRNVRSFVAPEGVRCIELDPEARLLLDYSRADDIACTRPMLSPLRARLVAALSLLLSWIGP